MMIYDFDSGDLSLDFANTRDWHGSDKPVEKLNSYTDLVAWGEQAGLLTPAVSGQLLDDAEKHPQDAAQVYDDSIQLREAIYRIFSSHYAGESPLVEDLELLNHFVRQAMAQLQLVHTAVAVRWDWAPGVSGSDRILLPVARAAAELLTSEQLSRVRECEDDRGCGYLFIDQTKNRSRRWCSMDSCGNRAKARRHYSRHQVG